MRQFERGMFVKSKMGHDAEKIYVIMDIQSEYLYLVDGKIRTLDRPKKKKISHVQPILYKIDQELAQKIDNKTIINEEIKYAIKLFCRNNKDCQIN